MVDVSNAVGKLDELTLKSSGNRRARVIDNGVSHLPAEVESLAVSLQLFHHAQALCIVGKGGVVALLQGGLARVSEGGVSQIVAQSGGLGQILVEAQSTRHDARDLGDLQRVGQTGAVMVARRGEEYLGLIHQPTEGLTMDDAVTVALKFTAHGAAVQGNLSSAGHIRARCTG